MPATYVTSSGTKLYEKKKKNENLEDPLRPQFFIRAMTPRTSLVACVDPCGKAIAVVGTYAAKIEVEKQDALTRPTYTSRKATAVVGNYAAKIVTGEQGAPTRPTSTSVKATPVVGSHAAKLGGLNDEEGARRALPAATFRKRAPGDRRGKPEPTRPSSRSTITFELLRRRQPRRRQGPTSR